MPTEKKIQAVQEMSETLSRCSVIIGTDYRGLNVTEATELRRAMREAGVQIQVVKNTLFLRAAEAAGMPAVSELAEGPTAIVYGFDDPLAPIKTVVEYQRQARNAFQVRKAYWDGEIIEAIRLTELASLPPREVMIAEVAGALQSPISDLVYLLSATLQEFSSLLDARGEQIGGDELAATTAAPEETATAETSDEATAEAETATAAEEVTAETAEEPSAAEESETEASEETADEPEGSAEDSSTEEESGEEDGN